MNSNNKNAFKSTEIMTQWSVKSVKKNPYQVDLFCLPPYFELKGLKDLLLPNGHCKNVRMMAVFAFFYNSFKSCHGTNSSAKEWIGSVTYALGPTVQRHWVPTTTYIPNSFSRNWPGGNT